MPTREQSVFPFEISQPTQVRKIEDTRDGSRMCSRRRMSPLSLSIYLARTFSLSHTQNHSLTHCLSLSHTQTHSIAHSLTLSLSLSHTHTLTHTRKHTRSLTQSSLRKFKLDSAGCVPGRLTRPVSHEKSQRKSTDILKSQREFHSHQRHSSCARTHAAIATVTKSLEREWVLWTDISKSQPIHVIRPCWEQ